MVSYIQRLDFTRTENTCQQCAEGCEDLDNYYHNPSKCLIRKSEKNKGVILK